MNVSEEIAAGDYLGFAAEGHLSHAAEGHLSHAAEGHHSEAAEGVKLVGFGWHELGPYVVFSSFLVLSGIAKVTFHHAHFISSRIPESCLLVLLGLVFGSIIKFGELYMLPTFTADLFFDFLLPPIILEAAYSLHHRAFRENLRTILLFAVVGTAFNFLLIGGLLVAVNSLGWMGGPAGNVQISLNSSHHYIGNNTTSHQHLNNLSNHLHLDNNHVHNHVHNHGLNHVHAGLDQSHVHNLTDVEIFTFASLISAVDPVAVLAIFSEIGVNSDLYFIVFGESLLNDGVAVVFYRMMISFAGIVASGNEVTFAQCILGILSFLTIALGGLAIGITVGLLTGLVTKATNDVSVIEPLLVLGLACISYYVSELFHWSGIISLIGCGIVQAHYSFINITKNSLITIEYFTKMASSTMDSVIFLYLGMNLLGWGNSSKWCVHGPFVAWTLFFCLVVRFLCVFLFSFFLNRLLVKKLNHKEQFIMAYGGLRGAVGFSLVISIQRAVIPSLDMLISTTLIVVMFTIWLQGGTIKALVNLLGIDRETDKERCLLEELNDSAYVNLSQGLNAIIGDYGWVYLVHKFDDFDETYLKNIFSKPDREHEMKKLYEEIVMAEHAENMYQPRLGLGRMEFVNEGFHLDEITEISKDGLCQDINENSVVSPASPAPFSRRVSEMSMRSNPSSGGGAAPGLSRRTSNLSVLSTQSGTSHVSGSSRSVRVALCDPKISMEDQEASSDELSSVLKRELRRRRSTVSQQAESMRRLSQCVPERRMSSVNANIERQRRISIQEMQDKVRRASTGEAPHPGLLAPNNNNNHQHHHQSQDYLEKRKRKTSVGHQIHLQQVLERVNSEAAAMSEMEREAELVQPQPSGAASSGRGERQPEHDEPSGGGGK